MLLTGKMAFLPFIVLLPIRTVRFGEKSLSSPEPICLVQIAVRQQDSERIVLVYSVLPCVTKSGKTGVLCRQKDFSFRFYAGFYVFSHFSPPDLYCSAVEADDAEDNSRSLQKELKFALFGGEATDEQLEEVKQFAKFVKDRDAGKI